jgi:CheY-like chemotaxis protein
VASTVPTLHAQVVAPSRLCGSIMETRLEILVAEDDPNDVFLLERALRKGGVKAPVHFVADGQRAIEYLARTISPEATHPIRRPNLLLLDLKLPRLNGFEVLEWIRTQPALNDLVVVVLSSSGLQEDKLQAYALGADSYVEKPSYPQDLVQFAQRLESFWTQLKRPRARDSGAPG